MVRFGKALALAGALVSGAAFAQSYTSVDVTGGGTVSGKVTFQGAKPALPPEKRNKDAKACGTTGPNQTLILGPGGGVKNVIVYLKDVSQGKKMDTDGKATLDQGKCSYSPHVQALPVGTTLTVVNSDPILHNVHATEGAATIFNYAMPIKDQKIPKKLTKVGFIKLKCDVHGWMNGAIGVMANPYFAVTGDEGSFTIGDVPPGTYTVAAWHETLGEKSASATVAAGAPATADLQYSK
jgi:plastocyanin